MFYHIIFMYRKITDEDIWGSSAALSFYLLLSFFPFMIALVSLMGFVPVDTNQILSIIKHFVPANVYSFFIQNINLLEEGKTSIVSIGFISAVWIASKGVKALMRALNKSYRTFDERALWKKYLISVSITLFLAVGIIVSVFLYVVFSHSLLDMTAIPVKFHVLLSYMRSVMLYIAMTVVMILMFKFVPDKKLRFRDVVPGALATGIIWVCATVFLGGYIDSSGMFKSFYGTLGSFIALMVWLYIICFSVLFGNAINSYRLESVKYE